MRHVFPAFQAQPVPLLPPMFKTNKLTRASISSRVGTGGGEIPGRHADRELLPSDVSDGPILKCIRVLSLLRTPVHTPPPPHCPHQLDRMAKTRQLRNDRLPLCFKTGPDCGSGGENTKKQKTLLMETVGHGPTEGNAGEGVTMSLILHTLHTSDMVT